MRHDGGQMRKMKDVSSVLQPPQRGENARDILHFSLLGDILPHRVAHLAHLELSSTHLELSSTHLGPTQLVLTQLKANLEPSWSHLGPPRGPWTLKTHFFLKF